MADLEKKKTARTSWFRETRGELKKVVWPNRQTVAKNTGTVLLCSLVIGACIWIFDFAATSLVKMILTVFGG
ncbi:MAG: preprotein translocase subunit SecE [Oscillibacter sp.]|nr:preprotein translocase subunit SecE [Oscillibacter sp.]